MGMQAHIAAPSVQDHGRTRLGTKKLLLPAKSIDGLPGTGHEDMIKLAGISQTKFIELMRNGEDQMIVRTVDKLLLALLDPLFFLVSLPPRSS